MKFIEEEKRVIPVYSEPDVLVVGAGPAGIGAAIAAARNGAKVLLLERYGFLGGNLTIAMVNPMFTFHDIKGMQVIRGIAGELVNRLVALKSSQGHITDLTFDNASMTPFDPEGMKYLLFQMALEAGVELLLHTWAVDVQQDGGKVTSVIIENKSGRQAICPKVIIDCSPDADIAAKAGSPFIKGREEDGAMQPVTLFYRIGGIDLPLLRSWMKQNRDLLKDSPTDEEIDSSEAIAFLGLKELVKKGMETGEFPKDAAPRILFYQLPQEGQIAVNATRLQGIDGTNAAHLTRAEVETRSQAWQIHLFLKKHLGGFQHSYILDTGVQVGVRETRHITGDYKLTEQDVLSNRAFEDGIACGTFAIDIHPPEGEQQIFTGSGKAVYEIPYRSLLPLGLDNVLVAGRSISATHTAFGSARVMATCMGIGQGAGVAASFMIKERLTTREVNTKALRAELIKQGQYLIGMDTDTLQANPKLALNKGEGSGATASHFNPFKDLRPLDNKRTGNIRWGIGALLFFVSALNYLDRQVLSVLAPSIQKELHLSDIDYSYITSSFLLSYTIMYAISGLVDKWGTRKSLLWFAGSWSVANILHGFAKTVAQFCGARFLLGAAESGNFPAGVKAAAEWFPLKERALAIGLLNAGSSAGAAVAAPLVSIITIAWGWQAAFVITGLIGFIWVYCWWKYYYTPQTHPRITKEELQYIERDEEPERRRKQ